MSQSSNSLPTLGRARRGVAGGSAERVSMQPLFDGQSLPLICRARLPGVDLIEWATANRELIEARLLEHGAILFRGFEAAGIDGFDRCVQAISGGALEYLFRASPRTQVTRQFNIYSSTDYPSDERIFPHNEHSYSPVFPLHLYFYCDTPSPTGGETPLGDTRELLRRIDPAVREEFRRRRIMYVRNYGDGMGLPWQTVFQSEDRAEVEAYCARIGIQPQWKPGNRLRTRQIGPAIVRHLRTGEEVWFNHGTFFNALTLPETLRAALIAEFAPEDLPQNTFYGDGEPIPAEVIGHLQQAYRDVMVEFPWQRGDVVLLDNILALHARNAFTGPRRILTAMAIAQKSADLALD
ncbi:TauD/TfdA family dioxygenase [Pseudomonas jinjuensis]|uniref:Taurine dioxygenase, alpha-ketoglutarate-dependent n=1 Tax=Pseudomonas jinjuensis TaxID=198616 RepID=A0A1H0HX71_9PSED|nr:TauD/TfdA family dioxygenase [Pseudomonas jinjuensis]SDO23757.1 Taurine dioxygenase, alpha-ketoglutarate-dependent [Pseudomonas jinjuensis]